MVDKVVSIAMSLLAELREDTEEVDDDVESDEARVAAL